MFGDSLWSFMVIAGPIILAVAIAWAMMRNRTSKRKLERTEEATRRNYDEGAVENQPKP